MTAAAKRFDDASHYRADIQRIVPGHGLLRQLAIATLQASVAPRGRLLVVGTGPGPELVEVAAALPGWTIDGLEPSGPMFASACEAVAAAGIGDRVGVHHRPLTPPDGPVADAILCLLVSHLVPLGGPRASFWEALGASLAADGLLVLAEIEAMDERERRIWRMWSEGRGCGPQRLEALDARLGGGFPLLEPEQTAALAHRSGLVQDGLVSRTLGLSLSRWRRRVEEVECP